MAKNNHSTATCTITLCVAINADTIGHDNTQRVQLIPIDDDNNVLGEDGRAWVVSDAAAVVTETQKTKTDLPLDYEHASLGGSGEPAPASGWCSPLTVEASSDGIYGVVTWTDRAAELIRNKEYKYTSSVFTYDKESREIIALVGSSLTHYPNLGDQVPVANTKEHNNMDELLEHLFYWLNLPKTSTPEEVKTHLMRIVQHLESKVGIAENSTLETLTSAIESIKEAQAKNSKADFVPMAEFKRVSTALNTLQDTLDQQGKDKRQADAQTAVNTAIAAGKVAPASKAWALDLALNNPESFKTFVATTVSAVPLGEEQATNAAGEASLTDDEIAICNQLNVSKDDFIKTKKGEASCL